MQPKGLDEKSRDALVEVLWDWLQGSDRQLKQTAARILGKGLIGEHIRVERPEPLRVEGFEEGIKRMMSDIPPESSEHAEATDAKELPN